MLLDGCRKIDDEVVEDMCTRFNGLRVLRLDGCELLTDESIRLTLLPTKVVMVVCLVLFLAI